MSRSRPDDDGAHSPLVGLSQRLPPSNRQAEEALLGALLANNKAYDRVRDFLRAEHFADPVNGRIYAVIENRIKAGQLADGVTLKAELDRDGMLEEVGGTAYLTSLLSAMVGIINAGEYGRAVHDAWNRRRLIDVGERLVENAFTSEPGSTGAQQAAAAMADLGEIASDSADIPELVPIGAAAAAAIVRGENIRRGQPVPGITCGWDEITKAIGPLRNRNLLMLGGRPGMGKTALAMQIATGAASELVSSAGAFADPGAIVFWSFEMQAVELGGRAASSWSRIPHARLERGDIDIDHGYLLTASLRKLDSLPLFILDPAGMTAEEMIGMTRAISRRHKLRLVITDHLLKLKAPGRSRRQDYIPDATSAIKDAARDLDLPWLLLTHLGKEVDRRNDPQPVLSDLAYAGEGDADVVLLMWRPEHYEPKRPPEDDGRVSAEVLDRRRAHYYKRRDALAGKAELIVAKNRHGPLSTRMLSFDGATMSFQTPLEGDERDPDLYQAAQ